MDPASHGIGEQHKAYRRGLVLGLTMAEVGILIIFVLLLLLALGEYQRDEEARRVEGQSTVPSERLRALEKSESLVAQLQQTLKVDSAATPAEISRLIRAIQERASTAEGQQALEETRSALSEMRRIQASLVERSGEASLATRAEEQSFRIANQDGQLKRYELQLKEAGLGKGERPCWVTPDGTVQYLYDIVLATDGIRMRERKYADRVRERELLPAPEVNPEETLDQGEFTQRTEPLYHASLSANCRFFVDVYDATGPAEKERYKELLRTVEGHFYKWLDRGSAPF